MNLSKSVNLALIAFLATLEAAPVSEYNYVIPFFSIVFFKTPVLAPLVALSKILVRSNLLNGVTCLGTPVVGPSIKTLLSLRISTIVANLPA